MSVILSLIVAALPLAESAAVSSANASYDGNALVLKGQVSLDHGLGNMKADEATLKRQEVGKDFPFSLIHLQQQVLLSLRNKAEIKCDVADLDFVALKGALSSQDRVVYTDHFKTEPFRILAKKIDLTFHKADQESPKTTYGIEQAQAMSDVLIEYAHQFSLLADTATYHQPTATITATSEQNQCRLSREEDTVDADTIKCDLPSSQLFLNHPKGSIRSLFEGHLQFSSNTAIWDRIKNTFVLRSNVNLEEPSLGDLQSEEIILVQGKKQGVAKIRSVGKTTLCYHNTHHLTAFGSLDVDREKKHISAQSPLVDGVIPEDQRICYREEEVTAIGNVIEADYTLHQNKLDPVSVTLKGDVRLYTHDPSKPARCGIADRVSYSPQTRTFILGADPGKKVLFINDEENLRISAQEVHVTEDPTTKKQVVKGIGHVQLAFSVEEEEQIQHLLELTKKLAP